MRMKLLLLRMHHETGRRLLHWMHAVELLRLMLIRRPPLRLLLVLLLMIW